jgi:hypothetical protein
MLRCGNALFLLGRNRKQPPTPSASGNTPRHNLDLPISKRNLAGSSWPQRLRRLGSQELNFLLRKLQGAEGEEKGIPRNTIHHEGGDKFKGTEPRKIISMGGGHDVQHDRASKCTGHCEPSFNPRLPKTGGLHHPRIGEIKFN